MKSFEHLFNNKNEKFNLVNMINYSEKRKPLFFDSFLFFITFYVVTVVFITAFTLIFSHNSDNIFAPIFFKSVYNPTFFIVITILSFGGYLQHYYLKLKLNRSFQFIYKNSDDFLFFLHQISFCEENPEYQKQVLASLNDKTLHTHPCFVSDIQTLAQKFYRSSVEKINASQVDAMFLKLQSMQNNSQSLPQFISK